MNIAKLILTITVVVLLAFAPAVAGAQTFDFTFNGNIDNTWDDPDNWDGANGPPGSGDTVLIPANKNCEIVDAPQSAETITIASTATLTIIGRTLTMSGGLLHFVKVDGELIFRQPVDGDEPKLLYTSVQFDGPFHLFGSGVVKARAVDGDGPGTIDQTPSTTDGVIRMRVTLKGSLTVRGSSAINNNGVCLVDNADDTMVIGELASSGDSPVLSGNGTFEASAGNLLIGRMNIASSASMTATWKASGGTIELTNHFHQTNWNNAVVIINNGGTFDVKRRGWDSRGGFSLTNGKINVSSSNTATFK